MPSRSCSFRLLVLVLVLVRAATVVVLRYLIAVELRFLQPLVDDVVDETAPLRCSLLRRYLRWVLLEDLTEVFGALSARIQSLEQVDILSQGFFLLVCRFLRESGERCVHELPCCAAELCPVRTL